MLIDSFQLQCDPFARKNDIFSFLISFTAYSPSLCRNAINFGLENGLLQIANASASLPVGFAFYSSSNYVVKRALS